MEEQLSLEDIKYIEKMKEITTPTEKEFEEYLNLYRESIKHIWKAKNLIERAIEEKEKLKRYKNRYGVELTKEQQEKQNKLEYEIWDLENSISVLQASIQKIDVLNGG